MLDIDIRLWGVKYEDLIRALRIGEHFAGQHPDKIGSRNCSVYTSEGKDALYAYRTPGGQIVVRPTT